MNKTKIYRRDGKWLIDEHNNRANVELWGSEEGARKTLESCSGCFDCFDCSRCSDCFDCSRCSDCFDCSRCSGCSRCSRCSGCFDCSDCSGCFDCSDCSGCSRCFRSKDQKEKLDIPIIKNIHQQVYDAASQPDALNMDSWHTCDTTHCRAGWVVFLAGKAGKDIEDKTSTLFAAMQIYKASGCLISPCRFFDSNESALEDMKTLAEREV